MLDLLFILLLMLVLMLKLNLLIIKKEVYMVELMLIYMLVLKSILDPKDHKTLMLVKSKNIIMDSMKRTFIIINS